jgi:hypothetical protein
LSEGVYMLYWKKIIQFSITAEWLKWSKSPKAG